VVADGQLTAQVEPEAVAIEYSSPIQRKSARVRVSSQIAAGTAPQIHGKDTAILCDLHAVRVGRLRRRL